MAKPIKYWYFTTYVECGFCGCRLSKTRERRPLPKPEDMYDRYTTILTECYGCVA